MHVPGHRFYKTLYLNQHRFAVCTSQVFRPYEQPGLGAPRLLPSCGGISVLTSAWPVTALVRIGDCHGSPSSASARLQAGIPTHGHCTIVPLVPPAACLLQGLEEQQRRSLVFPYGPTPVPRSTPPAPTHPDEL